jgi:hypothetical protein
MVAAIGTLIIGVARLSGVQQRTTNKAGDM